MKKKHKFSIILVVALCIVGLYAYDAWGSVMVRNSMQYIIQQISNVEIVVDHEPVLPQKESVELLFLGDTMLDRGVLSSVRRNFDGDFKSLFTYVREYFDTADIIF